MSVAIILWSNPRAPMGIDHRVVETVEELLAVAQGMGFRATGVERNSRLRPELQGGPTFDGLCGPMWGGEEHPWRYETWDVYERTSR